MTKADQIRLALCDPAAPWYGSDLVPLVADYLDDVEKIARQVLPAMESGVRNGLSGFSQQVTDDIVANHWAVTALESLLPKAKVPA
jgi:hypothetical protein